MTTPEKPIPPASEIKSEQLTQTSLETPEKTTPEQIVAVLEAEARELQVAAKARTPETLRPIEQAINDFKELGRRLEKRMALLSRTFESASKNPGLEMAKHLAEWHQVNNVIERFIWYHGSEYFIKDIKNPVQDANFLPTVNESYKPFALAISGHWSYFASLLKAAASIEAYIQPLLQETDKNGLPIRALMASLRASNDDFINTAGHYGVAVDDLHYLAPVPPGVTVDNSSPPGCLYNSEDLPLKEMHQLVREKIKTGGNTVTGGSDYNGWANLITDVREWGWSFQGERVRQSKVIIYWESTWLTALSVQENNYVVVKFRTS